MIAKMPALIVAKSRPRTVKILMQYTLPSISYSYSSKRRTLNLEEYQKTKLTPQLIEKTQSLQELTVRVNFDGFTEKDVFRPFIRKFTSLLEKTNDPQEIQAIQRMLTELRRLSSSEMKSNFSDLINFEVLFKKLLTCFMDFFRFQGFEHRVTMLAEAFPKILPLEGDFAKALALLHYMSTYTELSDANLKKSLMNYFYRYSVHDTSVKAISKHAAEDSQFAIQHSGMDIEHLLILVSSLNIRTTKINVQSRMDEYTISNLNKFWPQVSQFVGVEPLLRQYSQLKIKNHNESNITQLDFKGHFPFTKSSQILINSTEKFLQAVDIFVNLIKCNQTFLFRARNSGYAAVQRLSLYFQIVFQLFPKMKVSLFRSKDQMKKSASNKIINQKEVETIFLWKIAAQMVENMVHDRVYVARRTQILSLILQNTLKLISLKKSERDQALTNYSLQILKILTYMPSDLLSEAFKSQEFSRKTIVSLLTHLSKNFAVVPKSKFDLKSDKRKQLTQTFIKLFQYKEDLIADEKQWSKLFAIIAERDQKTEFWDLYFFFGSYVNANGKKPFEKIIPINNLISRLNREKQKISKLLLSEKKERKTFENVRSDREVTKLLQAEKLQKISSVNYYEAEALRLYALFFLLEKEEVYFNNNPAVRIKDTQVQKLKANLSKSSQIQRQQQLNISLNEMTEIFDRWIEPFSFHLFNVFYGTIYSQKQYIQKIRPHMNYNKPIPFFQKLYISVFIETCCSKQFRLLNKILTHPKFLSFYNNELTLANLNFSTYTKVVMLGLEDSKNRAKYLQKFPLTKWKVDQMRDNILFTRFASFLDLHQSSVTQWKYFLNLFKAKNQIFSAKDLFGEFLLYQNMLQVCISQQAQGNQDTGVDKSKQHEITHKIIELLIHDANLDRNYELIIIIKISVVIFFLSLASQKIKPTILVEKYSKDIIGLFLKYKIDCSDKSVAICLYRLDQMGFINEQVATELLKKLQFPYNHDIGKVILTSHIPRIAISQEVEANVFKISSLLKYSLVAVVASIRVSGAQNFPQLIKICEKFYNPEDRFHLFSQLKRKSEACKVHSHDSIINENIRKSLEELDCYRIFKKFDKTLETNILNNEDFEFEIKQEKIQQQQSIKGVGIFKKKHNQQYQKQEQKIVQEVQQIQEKQKYQNSKMESWNVKQKNNEKQRQRTRKGGFFGRK